MATVEGRLKTFVSRLIQCNENSKQMPGEVGKPSIIRSTLFDVSFLMLTSIVQTYGSDVSTVLILIDFQCFSMLVFCKGCFIGKW